jgi:hypothetical protein
MRNFVYWAAAAVLLGACGKDDGGSSSPDAAATPSTGLTAKCMFAADLTADKGPACANMTGATSDQRDSFKNMVCSNAFNPGSYTADASCDAAGVVYECALSIQQLNISWVLLYYPNYTREGAAADCEIRKSFIASQMPAGL